MRAASFDSPREPARIAIVRLSHLGDVVLALPLFHALRARFPSAEIAWVVQREFASLLEGMPGLARVVRFERKGGARAWLALRSELAAFAPELCVDAQGNLKSAFATWASGASRRVGLARGDWRERSGALLVTELAAPSDGRHAMQRTLALCRHVAPALEPRNDLALTQAELARGRERYAGELGAPRVIVHVPAAGDARSWPAQRIGELVRELIGRDERVLLVAGPAEREIGAALAASFAGDPRVRIWSGELNLRELAGALTAAARAGTRFVGCDSGPLHLAASCALRVVALHGPTSHERTGPWPIASSAGGLHTLVRSLEPPACAPCLARECTHASGNVCMSSIAPAQVLAALAR